MWESELYDNERLRWVCPLCDYETMMDERFGLHLISEHDTKLVELGEQHD